MFTDVLLINTIYDIANISSHPLTPSFATSTPTDTLGKTKSKAHANHYSQLFLCKQIYFIH